MATRCREWAAAAAVLGAVLGLALAPGGAARAEILAAELQVNGMACPFCAFGIEMKLLDVEGVERVDIVEGTAPRGRGSASRSGTHPVGRRYHGCEVRRRAGE